MNRRKQEEEDQHVNILRTTKGASIQSPTAGTAAATEPTTTAVLDANGEPADYWQLNWPDEDDDVDFFPHLDLESEEMVEAEEDATRL